jgi:zinc protease
MRPAASLVSSLLLAIAVPALADRGPAPAPPAVAPATDVRVVTLRNGVRLLLAPDPGANAVDVALWFPRRERPGLTGITHLFEGLLSGSAADPREHDQRIAALAGSAGAYTTPDLQCFQVTVPPDGLDEALRLEADRVASFGLGAPALERRRSEVAEERRHRAESMPLARALEALQRLAWRAGPYHAPLLGTDADAAALGLSQCQAWHRDHLGPKDVLVTIVGAFDPDRVLPVARRWFEAAKPRRPVAEPVTAEPAQTAERRAVERIALPAPVLVVGWRVPSRAQADGPALTVLSRILTAGPASRLQTALAADPLRCVAVQGLFDGRRDGGLLCALAMARPGTDSAAVERALFAEADRLAREPVSPEELERARRQEEIAILTGWQTARGQADALGSAQLLDGDWRAAATWLERVRTLTPEDLRGAAARLFVASGRCVLWVLPEGGTGAARGSMGSQLDPDRAPPAGSFAGGGR